MAAAPVAQVDSRDTWPRWAQVGLPSWLASAVAHASILILLALSVPPLPRGLSARGTVDCEVPLQLEMVDAEEAPFYEDEGPAQAFEVESSDAGGSDSAQAAADETESPADAAASVFGNESPVDITTILPVAEGPSASVASGSSSTTTDRPATSVGAFGGDGAPPRRTPSAAKARTRLFGVSGEGYKFVYVFDRSGSMGGTGRFSPLEAAKRELLASLGDLGEVHQFQVIFYNDRPTIFALAGQPGRLVFGNERNKASAQRFIESIHADGGTRHEDALNMALGMQPDVIFFLTDADQPALSKAQLDRIRRKNSGRTTIHAVEFGLGPKVRSRENFLMQLARENGGNHVYLDVSQPLASR